MAISGTHDTDTLAEWWDSADGRERHLCAEIPGLREAGCDPDAPFDDRLRDALLQALFRAGSDIVIVPFQDLFGWRDRVNLPGVVNDENWTWRLPWAIDELLVRAGSARARRIPARAGAGVRAPGVTPNSQPPTPKGSGAYMLGEMRHNRLVVPPSARKV